MRKLFSSVFLLLMIFFICLVSVYASSSSDESVLGNDRWSVTSSGDLVPVTTAVYDIGDATHYVGNAYITALYSSGQTLAGDLLPSATDLYDLGSAAKQFDGVYANGATVDTLTYNIALVPAATASSKVAYELFTTGDTLTAADSGKNLVTYNTSVIATGIFDFVLPAVSAGLQYHIVAGDAHYIRIDPYNTDAIMYSTNVAGDKIKSANASADSVTLVSDGTRWYVTEMKGTWTDDN